MKKTDSNYSSAFTLVEMLVVITIIGILAGILVPVIARSKLKAKIAVTKVQIKELENAIKMYKSDYSRFPAPKDYPKNNCGDFSVIDLDRWNDVNAQGIGWVHGDYPSGGNLYQGKAFNQNTRFNNSDVMKILMSEATDPYPPNPSRAYWWEYPRQSPQGANVNNSRNPKKRVFIDLKPSGQADSVAIAGLSKNGIYRDPFGNQFNISMDLNGDGFCTDSVYSNKNAVKYSNAARLGMGYKIVEGAFGALAPTAKSKCVIGGRRWVSSKGNISPDFVAPVGLTVPGTVHWFARKSEVMVWTAGPDGMSSYSCEVFGDKGDKDYDGDGDIDEDDLVNDDNILGWN
ncbi:MAG: prepilin-type N-terminal cleavage/methylation domain-containing protein [Verrucomicrobiota bacterium]|jgi:prepilin-type N-terminal cleavage/methylation domain-containing protein|nr:prepilin-type N-terminal cleavage/methylation domain-containing protein [Verrucomicrobiota bacterium]